jgi:hypothetical protein
MSAMPASVDSRTRCSTGWCTPCRGGETRPLRSAAFRHDLSAFLNSARSVLQFAHKEAKPKPGGQAWYDSQIASSLVCQFFKDERDRNIHEKPTHPKAVVSTKLGSNVKFMNAGKYEVHREGQVIQRGDIKDPPQDKLQPESAPVRQCTIHFR